MDGGTLETNTTAQEAALPTLLLTHPIGQDKSQKFLTTRRFPLYCLTITKSGCTFLKNLLYALDHGHGHPAGDAIHDHMDDLRRARDVPSWMIRRSPYAFTVMRHPVARFVSLYFDKIYRDGPRNFGPLRRQIAEEAGLDLSPDLPVEAHRRNASAALDWIAAKLRADKAAANPHWRPQVRRLEMVAHFNPMVMTLEGLNWQLPLHFHSMIPDMAARMANVTCRNKTAYPVPPAGFITPDLETRILDLYAEDVSVWQAATAKWERRKARAATGPAASDEMAIMRPLTSHRVGLNIVTQPKAGCTYMRNLVYAIDHGHAHPDPLNIEADNCLFYRDRTKRQLATSINIAVLRDPVRRFLSLYFDKAWGQRDPAFSWLANRLAANRGFRLDRDLSIAGHRRNLDELLKFLEMEFEIRPADAQNPHWRPQWVRAARAIKLGFVPVTLEDAERQIRAVIGSRIRGLDTVFRVTKCRNETPKPQDANALIDPALQEAIAKLYAKDTDLYDRTLDMWRRRQKGEEWPDDVRAEMSQAG